jgi:hypothetical protein
LAPYRSVGDYSRRHRDCCFCFRQLYPDCFHGCPVGYFDPRLVQAFAGLSFDLASGLYWQLWPEAELLLCHFVFEAQACYLSPGLAPSMDGFLNCLLTFFC